MLKLNLFRKSKSRDFFLYLENHHITLFIGQKHLKSQ